LEQRHPSNPEIAMVSKRLRHDLSPWIAERSTHWKGFAVDSFEENERVDRLRVCFEDDFSHLQPERWLLRKDTFPGNLGMFRPTNVTQAPCGGVSLSVREQPLGVRDFSAAAITTDSKYRFGRFECTLRATNVPGVVTGFFLHRDSPRQEIDIEIRGNRPNQLLANVFYNPGLDGTRFDYGYRGTPVIIDLRFDASRDFHVYAIEWHSCGIKWFVDHKLVHERAVWDPTPIPHLPMALHLNIWPTSSQELAGKLRVRSLPASAIVREVAVALYEKC
jgi:beta-glucanase (GH16 family)